ncbi:MAG: ShlB/FhaC/HecB family hemolysin secretion/activation protein [Spongiibacteraceae bacterium]
MKPLCFAVFTCALVSHGNAQPALPNSGTILQQVQPAQPAAPSSTATELKVEPTEAAKLPASAPFPVANIRITGNNTVDTATMHALIADGEGRDLTLSDLGELAARITRYYRSQNYPLARAIIPAQTIQSGVVIIEVIEARYGSVTLNNQSRVNDHLLQSMLAPLQSGDVIAGAKLDRALLLLSDVPGAAPAATLKPGEAVGTSNLQVSVAAEPIVSGTVFLDNYGSDSTGRARVGAAVDINNPLHYGDVLSASGVRTQSDMSYGRLSYESLLNGYGTRAGISYSDLEYELGGSLSNLDANGTARVKSAWARQPLLRSRDVNLNAVLQYDKMALRDHIDVASIRTDREQENWTLAFSGDARDTFLSSAVNAWSLGWTAGRVGFDDVLVESLDAITANTQGRFSKLNANVSRLQSLGAKNMLYVTIAAQWANSNLDSSQKMALGGPYSVRAYDVGAVLGDEGYAGTVELRRDIGQAWQGQWQAVAFIDSAHVTVNENAWVAGTNGATLSGAGLGLNWTGNQFGSVRTYVATPIGSTPTLVGDTKSARAWVETRIGF